MRLLWAHDHKFYNYENKVYSKVQFGQDFWNRYLIHFEKINVVSRLYEMTDNDSLNIPCYNLSSIEKVEFYKAKFNGQILKNTKDEFGKIDLKKLVYDNDRIIVRLPSTIGNLVAIEAIKQNKEFAVELVGDPWDAYINLKSIVGKMYAPIMYIKTKYIVKKASQVLYVTNEYLQNRYKNKSMKNINASNVNLRVEKNLNIKEYKKHTNINIGLIGYLSSYKGIDMAIKALHILNKDQKNNFYLNILGTGDKQKYLNLAYKYKVLDKVEIKTLPSGAPIINWLDTMDIYIQPSKTEGLPRGLIEAMSRGLPAIGTKVGGIPELINNDYIIKKGDYKGLANKIIKLIEDNKLYSKCSKENFEKSFEYDSELLEEKRFQFYLQVKKGVNNESL
ncbi:glycosyltransferase [Mammaliicoccus fleurettii]|uniref:glycosyltransferase n=1 Tax=Mammaliicoccus TaxID=2803850 RepID=UPI001EFB7331|nr:MULTISPECIES: glycosyltransferase [Mammaliicoccus]MEB6201982.1 glycosyltransferase [Mammaliicoccus fleurettii]